MSNTVLNPWDSSFYTEKKAIEHGYNETDHLEHHGIKGMRWGVRRSPEQLGRDTFERTQDMANAITQKKPPLNAGPELLAAREEHKQNIKKLEELGRKRDHDARPFYDEIEKLYENGSLNKWLDDTGDLPQSSMKKMGLYEAYQKSENSQKEYDAFYDYTFNRLMENAKKLKKSVEQGKGKNRVDDLEHHGISNTVQKIEGGSQVAHKGLNPWDSSFYDEIEHYGVKGMKWGVRKERRRAEHTFHENYVNAYNRSKQDYIEANKGKGKTIREVNKDFVQKELQSKHDFVKANKGKGKTIEEVNNEYMKSVIDRYPPKERVPSKRDLKYQKKKKEQDIQTNIDKISSMTPEEADAFIGQLKRINTATRLNEERIRAISQTQLAEIQLQKAKLETINTGLSGIKTSMEVATKVSRTKVAKKAAQELGKRSSKKGS